MTTIARGIVTGNYIVDFAQSRSREGLLARIYNYNPRTEIQGSEIGCLLSAKMRIDGREITNDNLSLVKVDIATGMYDITVVLEGHRAIGLHLNRKEVASRSGIKE